MELSFLGMPKVNRADFLRSMNTVSQLTGVQPTISQETDGMMPMTRSRKSSSRTSLTRTSSPYPEVVELIDTDDESHQPVFAVDYSPKYEATARR